MRNLEKEDFEEKCALVQSLLPHIQQDVVERNLKENNLDVEATVDCILSVDESCAQARGHTTDAETLKALELLDINEVFLLEKTSYWLNLFPQLSHNHIKEVIKQNLYETDEVVLSALEATSIIVHEEAESDNSKKNLADIQMINDIILFEHTPQDIVENDLLLGDLNGIDENRIFQLKRTIFKDFTSLNETTIGKLLEEHRYHIGRVLLYIITEGLSESNNNERFNHLVTDRSVVQRPQRRGNVKLADPFAAPLKKSIPKPKKIINVKLVCEKLRAYYNDKTTEVLLKEIVNYYEGDETKALRLIDYLEKNEYIDESIEIVRNYKKENVWCSVKFSESNSQAQIRKSKDSAQAHKDTIKKPKKIKYAAYLRRKPTSQRMDIDFYESIEPVPLVVDLHGETVAGAVMTISNSVRNWWHRELYLRGNKATRMQDAKSLKALYNGPLKIITGKGLHSKNGISIIRIQCRNYLRLNFYTFEEHDGHFIVTGRQAFRDE